MSATNDIRYCAWCGDVWDNPDCESRCCELESEADAQARLHEMPALTVPECAKAE